MIQYVAILFTGKKVGNGKSEWDLSSYLPFPLWSWPPNLFPNVNFLLFLHNVKCLCHGLGDGFTHAVPWHWESRGCWQSCVIQAPWQLFSSKLEFQHASASQEHAVGLVHVTEGIPRCDLEVLFLPCLGKPLVLLHFLKRLHTSDFSICTQQHSLWAGLVCTETAEPWFDSVCVLGALVGRFL